MTFRLAYVPGATPGKWARTWRERLPDEPLELVQVPAADAAAALLDDRADAALARLPVDKSVFSAIALYEELPVVVVSRDHLLAATTEEETVAAADLADDVLWLAHDDVLYAADEARPGRAPVAYGPDGEVDPGAEPERPATAEEAIAWVAAGAGVTVVPMSLARLHHRKDVTHRVLEGGPTAPVGLVWVTDRTTDLVEEMVGIVRGRTANSSRGRGQRRDDDGAAPRGDKGPRAAGGPQRKSTPRKNSHARSDSVCRRRVVQGGGGGGGG
ncbi:LysR family transcriptional regulator substrate-binding protein, partial [Puerhibacterium sp. TATVAM-FAB25]|uniref:LysR family transcriptional regulator substrate-binding protein n=1 Tax=Puerhibacterium sp. TATVAM-FAB25 TaxID=3093699 RepID=UPI00397E3F71